ncbi:MAG: cation diffusion facilitator family transporter [Rhodospirillales bacterium]
MAKAVGGSDHDHAGDLSHSHGPGGHAHLPSGADAEKRILLVLAITFTFMLLEAVGGFISGSLALIADAGHMFTDVAALLLALAAIRLGRKPGDARRTFGYRRLEVLAAFTNGVLLILLTIWIVVEAIQRFFQPIEILSDTMLLVALAGLAANAVSLYVLSRGEKGSLNMRAALLHVLGDALGSIAAVGAALVIRFTDWTPIDPLLSLVMSLVILRSAWAIIRQATHILLEGTPDHLDRDAILAAVKTLPEVADAHHLHLWSVSNDAIFATLHVVPAEGTAPAEAIRRVKANLEADYAIGHTTVEVEVAGRADAG